MREPQFEQMDKKIQPRSVLKHSMIKSHAQ